LMTPRLTGLAKVNRANPPFPLCKRGLGRIFKVGGAARRLGLNAIGSPLVAPRPALPQREGLREICHPQTVLLTVWHRPQAHAFCLL